MQRNINQFSYPQAHAYYKTPYNDNSGNRFVGGFFAPFLLGGLAGAAVARPNYYGGPVGYPAPMPYPMPMPITPSYYSTSNYYYQ